MALSACSPVTVLNDLAPKDTYRREEGLSYGPGNRRQLDVYRPAHGSGPFPVVVFFYGGSWNSGRRQDYLFVGEALAERGIVAIVADYRLYPEVRYPAFLDDCGRATAYALEHLKDYGGDASRVFLMGHSAGAYNAAMVAFDPRWLGNWGHRPDEIRGFIGLAGPYNFLPITGEDIKPIFEWPNTPNDSQPIDHVPSKPMPSLLMVAGRDRVVDAVQNTQAFDRTLQADGGKVVLKRYAELTHAMLIGVLGRPLRAIAPVLDDIVAFIEHPPG